MKRFRLPLLAGLCLVAAQLIVLTLFVKLAPIGERWLGADMQNPGDTAVYLSYLEQGRKGHFLLENLFAQGAQRPRFDAAWSTLGVFSRALPSPLVTHELARIVFTLLLAFALTHVVRKTVQDERDAAFAFFLCIASIGGGWIWSVISAQTGYPLPVTPPADVASEFSPFSLLFGGAHAILSTALLLVVLQQGWNALQAASSRMALLPTLCAALLFLFHPYLLPVVGLFALFGMILHRHAFSRPIFFRFLVLGAFCILPFALTYLPLLHDATFRDHHLSQNILPLAPPLAWLFTLFPFVIVFGWRYQKKMAIRKEEQWLIAWICAVAFSALLPFPWKRKMTEAALIPFILLSFPFALVLRNWLRSCTPKWLRLTLTGCLIFAALFNPLHLLTSHLAHLTSLKGQALFYRPEALFAAWEHLKTNSPSTALILADDEWTNAWTPAYTGRRAWLGHPHETPEYEKKKTLWKEVFEGTDQTKREAALEEISPDYLLLTRESVSFIEALEANGWEIRFKKEELTILQKKDG